MGQKESMETSQSLFQNRRIQRSASFALFVLLLIALGFYSRRNWPADAAITIDIPSDLRNPIAPVSSEPPKQKVDELLYNNEVPEYDTNNMPTIPTHFEEIKDPVSTSVATFDTTIIDAITLDPTRVALIIETRPLPALPAVLTQFISSLPPAWVFRFVGSQEAFSIVMLSASLARHIKSGKLQLTEIPASYPVHSSETVSETFTNIEFYSEFLKPAEWLLIFQTDSMICSASEQSLDDWVEKGYSWVGAPWNEDKDGGNGGLSLRHVPSIIKVLHNESRAINHTQWEDRWFCDRLSNMAPPEVARTFSVESVYYERPLGYHLRGSGKLMDPEIWANSTRKRQIFKYCPETKIILGNMRLQAATETEDEKNENNPPASALDAFFMTVAAKMLDTNGKQAQETGAPTSATDAETKTDSQFETET